MQAVLEGAEPFQGTRPQCRMPNHLPSSRMQGKIWHALQHINGKALMLASLRSFKTMFSFGSQQGMCLSDGTFKMQMRNDKAESQKVS